MKSPVAILVATLLAGCVAAISVDDASISADLACEAARSAVLISQQITPTPKPTPGKCQRCSGTGLLPTDGRIRIECPDCKGTGKK